VDPHLLRTFVTVTDLGSFSAAARELGYTQSAVSQQIATLEADLGTLLLRRRPVALTDAGVRLREHAGPLLLRIAAARADVARLADTRAARLVVGVSALATTVRLAEALAAVRDATEYVTVRVVERTRIPEGVAEGTLDAGLLDGLAAPTDPLHLPDVGPLTTLAVAEEPLAVLLPPGHPLAGRRGLDLADLVDARWIDAPDAALPLGALRAAVGADGYRPALRYEGTDVRGLTALAAAGHGLALLPAWTAEDVAYGTVVPVVAPRLVHRTELLYGGSSGGRAGGPTALLATLLTSGR
jgi:DNA-binding transcriptional LysR family regulator